MHLSEPSSAHLSADLMVTNSELGAMFPDHFATYLYSKIMDRYLLLRATLCSIMLRLVYKQSTSDQTQIAHYMHQS